MGKQKGKTLSAAKALLERGPCDVMLQGRVKSNNYDTEIISVAS